MATELIGSTGKQFITQITLSSDSVLIGESINTNIFENSKDISILMVQRGEHGEFSPYVNYKLKKRDILIISTASFDKGILFNLSNRIFNWSPFVLDHIFISRP